MKVIVVQKFRDIHTNEVHHAGEMMDITEERYKEICSKNKNLVKEAKEEQQGEMQEDKLNKLKVDEIRKLAKEMGIDSEGKKEELIARIMEKKGTENEESEN